VVDCPNQSSRSAHTASGRTSPGRSRRRSRRPTPASPWTSPATLPEFWVRADKEQSAG